MAEKTIGEPLSPEQQIDARLYLSKEELGRVLIQHVVDKQLRHVGSWTGTVIFHFRTDSPEMAATILAWKDTTPTIPRTQESGTLRPNANDEAESSGFHQTEIAAGY